MKKILKRFAVCSLALIVTLGVADFLGVTDKVLAKEGKNVVYAGEADPFPLP